jgi:ribosomal protein S18 acetylase RimI-like enzyme
MDKSVMDASVHAIQGLDRISEIIALHNEIWKNSAGIIDLLKNSSGCFVLIDNAGKLIGYAFIEEDRKRGFTELQDIAVSPSHQNQGGGRLLMQAVMSSCSRIKLIARLDDKPLIRFYTGLGFNKESIIENYYNVGEDGLRMSWSREK